jgi:hypothetical protein
MSQSSVERPEVEAARLLLDRMGISMADLLDAQPPRPKAPTFAEYVPVVAAAVSPGTRKAYGSYWDRVVQAWGDRPIDEPRPSEIEQLRSQVQANIVPRRNSRGGRSAAEHLVAALRCLYRRAVADGYLEATDNPALKVDKPRRLPSTRRAIGDTRLAEINEGAAATGDDPGLDSLPIRLHTERPAAVAERSRFACVMWMQTSACSSFGRRPGRPGGRQPVSPTLVRHLLAHQAERGPEDRDGPLLRYRDGRPLTYRRYDHLWVRIGQQLRWVQHVGHGVSDIASAAVSGVGAGDRVAECPLDPGQGGVPEPMRTDLLRRDPRQMHAEPRPQVVIPATGQWPAIAVAGSCRHAFHRRVLRNAQATRPNARFGRD